jgi:hypothetical protein
VPFIADAQERSLVVGARRRDEAKGDGDRHLSQGASVHLEPPVHESMLGALRQGEEAVPQSTSRLRCRSGLQLA